MTNGLQQELRDAGYTREFDLSELIEACGAGLEQLWNVTKAEHADRHKWEAHTDGYCMVGVTPEEAVAMLYLALHGKETRTSVERK